MDHIEYISQFATTPEQFAQLAEDLETTVGHLRQLYYGYSKPGPKMCRKFVRVSGGVVKWELMRPDYYGDESIEADQE